MGRRSQRHKEQVHGYRPPVVVPPSLYLGQVATRAHIPLDRHASAAIQARSRSIHTARDDITALQLGFVNWQTTAGGSNPTGTAELNGSAAVTMKASIEYPLGSVPVLVKWAGANTKSIAVGGLEISDALPVVIPNGAKFAVRTYKVSTAANLYTTAGNAAGQGQSDMSVAGDYYEASATSVVDFTLDSADPGIGAASQGGGGYFPALILGMTRKPSVAILGDSIGYGAFDVADAAGDMGAIARSIGPTIPYIGVCTPGDRLGRVAISNAKRMALLNYASHVIIELGRNDISNNITFAQMQADWATVVAAIPAGKILFGAAVTPRSTSTDSWATSGANQTVETTSAAWLSFNDWLRTLLPGPLVSVFGLDDALAVARATDKWKSTGSAFGYTGDGTHPNAAGYALIKSSGVVNPALIVR